jgi:predicted esterase
MEALSRVLVDDVSTMTVVLPAAANHTWYPQRFIAPVEANQPYLDSALRLIAEVLTDLQHQGIPRERIVLGGFSQGACLAAEYLARNPARYGGGLIFSGGLIGPLDMTFSHAGDLAGTPVFVGCSDQDPHIPVERVHQTKAVLTDLNATVDCRIYPDLGHAINDDEIHRARGVVEALLP